MTLGFLLFAGGLALLYAGLKGQSIGDIIAGNINPDNPPPDFGTAASEATPAAPRTPGGYASYGGGYVNPFARAKVQKGRIDQGVDYTGRGPIVALGDAIITDVARAGAGWSGRGAYVEYKLTSGSLAGKSIYLAEDIIPKVRKGQRVKAGKTIATFAPTGSIESGVALGKGTRQAAAHAGYQEGHPTNLGQQFDQLLSQL